MMKRRTVAVGAVLIAALFSFVLIPMVVLAACVLVKQTANGPIYHCGPPRPHQAVTLWRIVRIPEQAKPEVSHSEIAELNAKRARVDPKLVHAMIDVESRWNPSAVSLKGARGLMQLMPETSRILGVQDPFDPHQNTDGGTRHIGYLIDRYRGNLRLALAAYNAGEGAVAYYRGIPPYPETQKYIEKVLKRYRNGS